MLFARCPNQMFDICKFILQLPYTPHAIHSVTNLCHRFRMCSRTRHCLGGHLLFSFSEHVRRAHLHLNAHSQCNLSAPLRENNGEEVQCACDPNEFDCQVIFSGEILGFGELPVRTGCLENAKQYIGQPSLKLMEYIAAGEAILVVHQHLVFFLTNALALQIRSGYVGWFYISAAASVVRARFLLCSMFVVRLNCFAFWKSFERICAEERRANELASDA